ncbi:hypothetical protein [Parachryseolinea silvisoli]|nr:hypothetical protein [Parachryseolinea silvisoli]
MAATGIRAAETALVINLPKRPSTGGSACQQGARLKVLAMA